MVWGIIVELFLQQSTALAITALGFYIGYEIRFGAMQEVRANQETLSVAMYRVIQRDEELDEAAFREAMWEDGEDDGVLLSDLEVEDEAN